MVIGRTVYGRGADQRRTAAVAYIPSGNFEIFCTPIDRRFQRRCMAVSPKHENRRAVALGADTANAPFVQSAWLWHAPVPIPGIVFSRCVLQRSTRKSRRKATCIDAADPNYTNPDKPNERINEKGFSASHPLACTNGNSIRRYDSMEMKKVAAR